SGNRGPVSAAFLEILPGGGNQFPTVTITNPSSGTTVGAGTAVNLVATASDVEDGNLTAGIVWTSSISGAIGTGGSASVVLTVGTHTITASVSDSDGADASDSIVVTVT